MTKFAAPEVDDEEPTASTAATTTPFLDTTDAERVEYLYSIPDDNEPLDEDFTDEWQRAVTKAAAARGWLVLDADERLLRFHAGHDMVKFFYSAVRQLPPYLVDALLDHKISVTLVEGPSLLVFHHAREHQSFHVGRTRRTIYIPERVLREANEVGYDYWAIS